ncbi:cell division ATP-binding protein FtsE [Oscillatoria sp. CS-180]|uniref:cell division ATP-binding protein FtsE n=1 Tax=Oscillatoria sp. CS-180 TaxID=3021720 RepID=UPI00232DB493|nr:cell division ATP-binding protein FtsE [Oscillatoria sp. CS-180]MDB9528338.1 cell division ATP-binding protein FtsE [Oscillatoria sp. CS-180]
MTSVVTRPNSNYERLPEDVRSLLSDRLQRSYSNLEVDRRIPSTAPSKPPTKTPQATTRKAQPKPPQGTSQRDVVVALQNVSKRYMRGTQALLDVNLQLHKGDFLFITGASGAGKSTFLKLLYGQEKPTAGEVIIEGTAINNLRANQLAKVRRRIGVVFQDYKLIPRRTVAENVAFVLWAQGYSRKEIHRRLWPTLKMVGLQDKSESFPDELSGGEQQRVSIARAVVGTPPLLLADEPTGNLDPDNALQVIKILKKLNSIGITVVVTTHNEQLVRVSNHPVVQLKEGRLRRINR